MVNGHWEESTTDHYLLAIFRLQRIHYLDRVTLYLWIEPFRVDNFIANIHLYTFFRTEYQFSSFSAEESPTKNTGEDKDTFPPRWFWLDDGSMGGWKITY